MFGTGVHSPEDRRFVGLADGVVDDIVAREPAHATRVGDHRFDDRLPNLTEEGIEEYVRVLRRHSAFLASVDERALSRLAVTDLRILRQEVSRRIFDHTQVGAHRWNPLVWNPADALHTLISGRFGPASLRARALGGRLRLVPEFLENARQTLRDLPVPHIETAIAQLGQIEPMLLAAQQELSAEHALQDPVEAATAAIEAHRDWLSQQLPRARRSAPLGAARYAGVVRHVLEQPTALGTTGLLARARADLAVVTDQLASACAKFTGGSMGDRGITQRALATLADDAPVDDDGVLQACSEALEASAAFITARGLMTVPQLDARIETMPGIHRGLSIATCDVPGALDNSDLGATISVAPMSPDWSANRRVSYYREYNVHMLHDLMVHEGLPGHVLQLTRARQARSATKVRAALPNPLLIEGWAVYAEELMADSGFAVNPSQRESFRIQQLKMKLRAILNTILDIGVHSGEMTEPQARRLLGQQGFQEASEVTAKWRRSQLTYGQLATYYVGYGGVRDLVADMRAFRPSWELRQVHDSILMQGSVSPFLLRDLVGLD